MGEDLMGGVCEGDFASANDRLDRPTTHNMSMRIQSARSRRRVSIILFDSYEQPIHLWDSLYVTLLETEDCEEQKHPEGTGRHLAGAVHPRDNFPKRQ